MALSSFDKFNICFPAFLFEIKSSKATMNPYPNFEAITSSSPCEKEYKEMILSSSCRSIKSFNGSPYPLPEGS